MKCLVALLYFFLSNPIYAFAQTESGTASVSLLERLAIAGRFFGGFLLVMGVIFVVLLSTRRLAAWIDQRREKKDKHNT